ncbi:hypothetical protein JHL17_28200 [Azospirillum sp. YIM B02556]|uniref:ParB/Sulfiredoxin domain-containing protein n=1 Tax=Azospirillum endophyticum TaxID=2800326 RepID=A0ABS1FD94_9PROT|nr:ParB/Srx family N-terminal domain-containing protein [Azospirillum endophyticum]MBK1841293.1 hypothetical protein [Azospirillum endophyticum]
MAYRLLPLNDLLVNRANDRHGELENETAAIAWLFNSKEDHMKALARDIVDAGEIYEPLLVSPINGKFVVFDGNRRLTCLKVLKEPNKAPNKNLQSYFSSLKEKKNFVFPDRFMCQVETDRDRVDDILFRRHTGNQSGVGQSNWDDRMKANFVNRTGKGNAVSVADEVEQRLVAANMAPKHRKLPRSTMNRLLSSEAFRNRVGFSVSRGKFEYTHQEDVVLRALQRIANDLARRETVLGDIWDVDGKRAYLDKLEADGLLPTVKDSLTKHKDFGSVDSTKKSEDDVNSKKAKAASVSVSKPSRRVNLIARTDYGIAWPGRLQRHRAIWEELQFHLVLPDHSNAVSVLFRVLLDLSIENYISQNELTVGANDKLSLRALRIAEDLHAKKKIDHKYLGEIKKFQHADRLISADTLHRYVHSPDFAPSPDHLVALWDTLATFIVCCLKS